MPVQNFSSTTHRAQDTNCFLSSSTLTQNRKIRGVNNVGDDCTTSVLFIAYFLELIMWILKHCRCGVVRLPYEQEFLLVREVSTVRRPSLWVLIFLAIFGLCFCSKHLGFGFYFVAIWESVGFGFWICCNPWILDKLQSVGFGSVAFCGFWFSRRRWVLVLS